MKTNFILSTILLIFGLTFSQAQLQVDSLMTAEQMVESILGDEISVSNVSINCPGTSAGGFSNGASTSIGLAEGILLTSGAIENAIGPNSATDTTTSNNGNPDPDLQALTTGGTGDACTLEFDFVANSNLLNFNYVFASEEYEEYFCTQYNDVFGFFVSGVDPAGGHYVNYNVAFVPGTQLPVTINNVGPFECQGVNNSTFYNNNDNGSTIEYDGFLDVFVAQLLLVPGESYHIKLGIADTGDLALDSGVFIEANSFSTDVQFYDSADIDPDCDEMGTGAVNLTLDNSTFDNEFLWSNGETTEDVSGLEAGTYSVDITRNYGTQSFTDTFFFNIPAADSTTPTFFSFPTTYNVGEAPLDLPTHSDEFIEGTWMPEEIDTSMAGTFTYEFTPLPGECATVTTVDITINPGADPCPNPENLNVTLTSLYSAMFNVDPHPVTTKFDFRMAAAAYDDMGNPLNPNYGMDNENVPLHKSSLHKRKTYTLFVRADCGIVQGMENNELVSDWIGPVSFRSGDYEAAARMANQVELYPNPARNLVNIKGIDATNVSIFNITGKSVSNTKVNNNNFNVTHLLPGNYIVQITDKKGKVHSVNLIIE